MSVKNLYALLSQRTQASTEYAEHIPIALYILAYPRLSVNCCV